MTSPEQTAPAGQDTVDEPLSDTDTYIVPSGQNIVQVFTLHTAPDGTIKTSVSRLKRGYYELLRSQGRLG